MGIKFSIHASQSNPNVLRIHYDCPCGCKPSASYERHVSNSGSSQCCCGRVCFVGLHADQQLRELLSAKASDAYTFYSDSISTPWNENLPIAYAVPEAQTKC
jgi:hypothetical protein